MSKTRRLMAHCDVLCKQAARLREEAVTLREQAVTLRVLLAARRAALAGASQQAVRLRHAIVHARRKAQAR